MLEAFDAKAEKNWDSAIGHKRASESQRVNWNPHDLFTSQLRRPRVLDSEVVSDSTAAAELLLSLEL